MAQVARTSTTGEGARVLAGLRSGDGPLSVRVRPSSQPSGPDGKGQTEPGPRYRESWTAALEALVPTGGERSTP